MKKKKMIITGGKGFLGSRFEKMWRHKYEIRALGSTDLDVTDIDKVMKYITDERPDYVIHLSGIPNQQFCIAHPEKAYAVNVLGALYVAKACKECGAKLVFTSTEQLFNGSKEDAPYKEDAAPMPNTVYGQNKWEVEQKLPEIFNEYWIIRMTWLFGLPERHCKLGSNILWNTINAAATGKIIKACNYEYRGMTDVNQMAFNIEKLFQAPYGTYHMGSTNDYSRYEIAEYILKKIGLSKEQISHTLAADNSKYNADNVRDLRLDTAKAKEYGISFLPTKDAIDNCLKEFGII